MASGDPSVSYSSSEESLEEYVDGTTLDDCDGTQPYMFEQKHITSSRLYASGLSRTTAKLARVANRTVVMLRRRNSSDCRILTGKIPCNSASVLGIPTFFNIND